MQGKINTLTYSTKKCFIAAAAAGNITTTVNKGRQARPMSSLLPLDVFAVYWEKITLSIAVIFAQSKQDFKVPIYSSFDS